MIYHCCDRLRRDAVAAHPKLNGIDHLEVLDSDAPNGGLRQRTLLVRLLKPVPATFSAQQVSVEGGEREREIRIEWVSAAADPPPAATQEERVFFTELTAADRVLLVRTDRYGDFSTYRLRLVHQKSDDAPPPDFDPQLCEVPFSFKVDCPSEFDCKPRTDCAERTIAASLIDYLAKDYPSFRRLILERLTRLVPDWRERSAADLGVTLAELLAYVGDQLSYQQDAVATEAYLETARLRTSLRRHALLVDYHVHDGCNARVWLHLPVDANRVVLKRAGTRFYTRLPGLPPRIVPDSRDDKEALRARPTIFEPIIEPGDSATLHEKHNRLDFYTWGDRRCCLPAGATHATLAGHFAALKKGDVLLFEEVCSPATGQASDADPTHRHVVRLTAVHPFSPDQSTTPLTDPLSGRKITEIAWAAEDALPFPLCISALTDRAHGAHVIDQISVARGNMVLADHGHTLADAEDLGAVPAARLAYPAARHDDRCAESESLLLPPRFRPRLIAGPLTCAATVPETTPQNGRRRTERLAFDPRRPAAHAMRWSMADVFPAIELTGTRSTPDGTTTDHWEPHRDLLNSERDALHFVVEVEHDGSAALRFGDDVHARRPPSGTHFHARYRVGNGRAGNVGADTIAHAVTANDKLVGVRNPLPAHGGVDGEDAAAVRRSAPQAFRRQERAVTPADYAEVSQRHAGVQRAAATLRWTGSWHTVFITVDRDGGLPLDDDFEAEIGRHVDRYRMAGHDTEFDDPVYVALEIDLQVCVAAGHLRSEVRTGLLALLGNRRLPDGRRGLFHADGLSFGQTVYLGPLYAAARQVAGVDSLQVTRFQRQGSEDPTFLGDGFMRLSRLEIPRLDNDPNFPEHGVLRLDLSGGR